MAKKISKQYPRTIAEELHEAWQKLKRKRDGELMAKELQYSRPVIDRALNYGYVAMPELPDLISKWLMDRLKNERSSATELLKSLEDMEVEKNG